MKQLAILWIVAIFVIALLGVPLVYAVIPFGATVTPGTNETAPQDAAGNHAAIAGNVTELTLTAFTTTQSWQGYYGNVSGTIQLADGSDNVMYNWSLTSPEGEVYASTNDSVNWATVMCFNFTAQGTYASDVAQAGATSYFGTNLSTLEATFNITWDDVDGLNETFDTDGSLPGNAGTHDLFYTNNLQFADGECLSMNVFRQGSGQDNYFEEVLLYDSLTRSVVFTSLLEESDTLGFDSAYHDFQMLVLENGHGTDTSTTTYYFYVEIE